MPRSSLAAPPTSRQAARATSANTIGSRGARRLGSSGTRLGVPMSVTTAPVHLSDRRPRRHRATLQPCPLASHCLSSATYPSVHVRILPLRGSSSPKTVDFTGLGAPPRPLHDDRGGREFTGSCPWLDHLPPPPGPGMRFCRRAIGRRWRRGFPCCVPHSSSSTAFADSRSPRSPPPEHPAPSALQAQPVCRMRRTGKRHRLGVRWTPSSLPVLDVPSAISSWRCSGCVPGATASAGRAVLGSPSPCSRQSPRPRCALHANGETNEATTSGCHHRGRAPPDPADGDRLAPVPDRLGGSDDLGGGDQRSGPVRHLDDLQGRRRREIR